MTTTLRRDLAAVALLLLAASGGLAQEPPPVDAVADDAIEAAKETAAADERKDGWDVGLKVGGSASFLHNSLVVGQDDGVTLSFGGVGGAHANFVWGDHEWRNLASLEHMQTKTPALDPFLKSADMLDVSSLYLYRIPFVPWVGPYARARMFTPVFPGQGVRPVDVTTRRVPTDTTLTEFVDEQIPAQTPYSLTGFFEPLTITEGLGGFVEPLSEDYLTLGFKVGAAGQHLLAQDLYSEGGGGYVNADNADTPEIELAQLVSTHSAGAEAEMAASGAIVKDLLTWGMIVNVYYPLLISVPTDLDAVEVTHVDTAGNISLKLKEGVSLDYVLRLRRAPFVLNDWQMQNSVLLTLGISLL